LVIRSLQVSQSEIVNWMLKHYKGEEFVPYYCLCPSISAIADIAWADAVKYACVRTLKEYGGAESSSSFTTEFAHCNMQPAGRTGFITRTTFAPMIVMLLYAVRCYAAFSLFDSSGDGRVSFSEFQEGLLALGVSLSPSEIETEMLDCAPLATDTSRVDSQHRAKTSQTRNAGTERPTAVVQMTYFLFSDWLIRKDTSFTLYSKGLAVKVAAERQKKIDRLAHLERMSEYAAQSLNPNKCLHQGCVSISVCGYIGPSRQVTRSRCKEHRMFGMYTQGEADQFLVNDRAVTAAATASRLGMRKNVAHHEDYDKHATEQRSIKSSASVGSTPAEPKRKGALRPTTKKVFCQA
jgi:hypothetical protein